MIWKNIKYLFFYNSSIFPFGKYFFLVSVVDDSKEYRPMSKCVLDIPTAVNFFGYPDVAIEKIGSSVRRMAGGWNAKYAGKQEVRTFLHSTKNA